MAERMTIHRALAELKTLDARIEQAISAGIFCVANKNSNTKIAGSSIEDFKKLMQGDFDKVRGLIDRRNVIKSAIVQSNAITDVVVGGVTMKVAEAIERKSAIQYDRNFLYQLQRQFKKSNGEVNTENEKLPQKLETYLQSVLGGKDNRSAEDVKLHTDSFMKNNTYDLIDPNQLNKATKELENSIFAFDVDVDATLSESNATTFIEI